MLVRLSDLGKTASVLAVRENKIFLKVEQVMPNGRLELNAYKYLVDEGALIRTSDDFLHQEIFSKENNKQQRPVYEYMTTNAVKQAMKCSRFIPESALGVIKTVLSDKTSGSDFTKALHDKGLNGIKVIHKFTGGYSFIENKSTSVDLARIIQCLDNGH